MKNMPMTAPGMVNHGTTSLKYNPVDLFELAHKENILEQVLHVLLRFKTSCFKFCLPELKKKIREPGHDFSLQLHFA